MEPTIDLTADPQRETAQPATDRPVQVAGPSADTRQDRDPYIQQAIDDARERQESWERGIDPDRDNDRGFGIE
jgi:hypothetical protein